MKRLPLDFVRCVDCGHVFNSSFDYREVPYSTKPNLMFNRGALWSRFLTSIRGEILRCLPPTPVVVEVGYGDGRCLSALAQARPRGRYAGFDPNGTPPADARGRVEWRGELFEPARHVAELKPDLILSRHVLEHMTNPLGFIQGVTFGAAMAGLSPLLYLEVPCIDRVFDAARTEDFYYEHNSHFSTESFRRMLSRSGAAIDSLGHGYDGEVVYAFLHLKERLERLEHGRAAARFRARVEEARHRIASQLETLVASGRRVAVWGGTGKAAAFLNAFAGQSSRIPVVVDSDPEKAGTYVPGTGQLIHFRDWLKKHPADVVLIPTQWRARDILREMRRAGIRVPTVLIEHDGRLVDYRKDQHPYRPRTRGGAGVHAADLERLNRRLRDRGASSAE